MPTQLEDGDNPCDTQTPTADRRSSVRRWTADLARTRYVVVLNLGPAHRAELINESNNGIAVQVRALNPNADIGQTIEVIYRGARRGAEVRHIAAKEHGFLVGLQWKNRYTQ